ncbi:hypothetical protein [Synechococcus sp. CBW1107]|uniref:beta strand repeat-containing protein n=1 Tax=Synechococcus sp. CBW1107 TaxID=2789857 RepID=UPI002AD28441|nr:hypothetical protein [Synechococcus sp. CBW1107]CAK6690928.1 hypothetical protein IFHNHDMJ_00913 [Synechococcus sp. CBW1107]
MAFFNPGANASADSLFISLDNSPVTTGLDFSGIFNTGQLVFDASGNFTGDLNPNATVAQSTQDEDGFSVASESVNLGQIGIKNSDFLVGTNGIITVSQLGVTQATTTNLGTSGNAYAGAVQNFEQSAGNGLPFENAGGGIINTNGYDPSASPINAFVPYGAYGNSDILIGRQGQINVSVDNRVSASAISNNGVDASGEDLGDWALGSGINPLGAFSSEPGGSVSGAIAGNTYGIYNTSIAIGGGTDTTNTVAATLAGRTSATSQVGTVDASGNLGGDGNAVAIAGLDLFYNDQYTAIASGGTYDSSANPIGPMVLQFGTGSSTVIGRAGTGAAAPIFVGAEARTGTGNAGAFSSADQFGGITQAGVLVDPSNNVAAPGLQILIGGNGTVEGTAKGVTDAIATTQEGDAFAVTQVDEVFGIVDNNNVLRSQFGVPGDWGGLNEDSGSAILIDGNGTIAAGGSIESNAFAKADSLDPSGTGLAYARTDNSYVVGLSLGGIIEDVDASGVPTSFTPGVGIGGDGNFRVFADSTQTATAVSNFTNDPSGNVDPFAASASEDVVVGILDTEIEVGGNLTNMNVVSQLNAQSAAFSISDIATAESGNESYNAGISGSGIFVQGNANTPFNGTTGPIFAIAQTDLATFAGTTGDEDSDAVTGGDFGGRGTSTIGIDDTFIEIGGSGTVLASAVSDLDATAGYVYDVTEQGVVDPSGNGPTGFATSNAFAGIGTNGIGDDTYKSAGISNSLILIDEGTFGSATTLPTIVQGTSDISADAFAFTLGSDLTATEGAVSQVNLLSDGIELGGFPDDGIKIRRNGDIVGTSSILGSSIAENDGTGLNGTGSDATASADINADGIDLENGSYAVVGLNGDIVGSSALGTSVDPFRVTATTEQGDATATGNFSLSGIEAEAGTLLKPGAQTGNINAQVFSNTVVTAGSQGEGAANATSNVDGIGLNTNGTPINLGTGNVTGISQVFNTVQAYNSNGTAVAVANTEAFGIKDTPITFSGSGSIFASAGGNSVALSGITPTP